MVFSYTMAGNAYRIARKFEQAKEAFEKASKGHEMQASYVYSISIYFSADALFDYAK